MNILAFNFCQTPTSDFALSAISWLSGYSLTHEASFNIKSVLYSCSFTYLSASDTIFFGFLTSLKSLLDVLSKVFGVIP
jgi:hypothetical protein